MDKETLEKLAYLSLVSNSISAMLGRGDIPKATLHRLQPVRNKIDKEFLDLILSDSVSKSSEDKDVAKRIEEEKKKMAKKVVKKSSDASK